MKTNKNQKTVEKEANNESLVFVGVDVVLFVVNDCKPPCKTLLTEH